MSAILPPSPSPTEVGCCRLRQSKPRKWRERHLRGRGLDGRSWVRGNEAARFAQRWHPRIIYQSAYPSPGAEARLT